MSRPRTIVVVLTYNGVETVEACLASVLEQTPPPGGFACWLVDNGSADGTLGLVQSRFPNVKVLENSENLGFAGGNNRGIQEAIAQGAEFVALLNMDAVAEPGWLSELVRVGDDHPKAALLGSLVLDETGTEIEFDGRQFDSVLTAGGYSDRPLTDDDKGHAAAAYACGAAVLLRTSVLQEIGLLADSFFLYHEDVELSLRAWRCGYEVLNVRSSRVRHARSDENAASREYLGLRNLTATLFVHYDEASWLANREAVLGFFLEGDSPARLQAAGAAFGLLPDLLRQRRALRRRFTRTYSDVISELRKRGVLETPGRHEAVDTEPPRGID